MEYYFKFKNNPQVLYTMLYNTNTDEPKSLSKRANSYNRNNTCK